MVTVLTGENSFEIERTLAQYEQEFSGVTERLDGSELRVADLPNILMGGTLFAAQRLIFIKYLTDNTAVWNDFADWLPRIADDTHVVLVEPKLDKRTKTYKELKKVANIQDYTLWSDRDRSKAEVWAVEEAAREQLTLERASARHLVARVGVDQWALAKAIQKLALVGEASITTIDTYIEMTPHENVFYLFEAALKHDASTVSRMVRTLELTEDPYQVFGLLNSQLFQLTALVLADQPSSVVAKDIGAHPFALSKLESYAKKLTHANARQFVLFFAEADDAMKSTATDPWLLVERALLKVSA